MRNLFDFFRIILKRLGHSLGLTVSALVGIVCVLTIAIAIPIFSFAVSGELLRQQLTDQAEKSGHPLFSIRMYYLYDSSKPLTLEGLGKLSAYLPNLTTDLVDIQPEEVVVQTNSPPVDLKYVADESTPDWSRTRDSERGPGLVQKLRFATMNDLPEHARLLDGAWPDKGAETIQVAIHNVLANFGFFNAGQLLEMPDGTLVEISGIWEEEDPADPYWYDPPDDHFRNLMWLPEEIFAERLSASLEHPIRFVSWYLIMDENDVRFQNARQYTDGMIRLDNELRNLDLMVRMDYSPLESLVVYQERVSSLNTLLYAVGAPLVVLALLFISLASIIVIQEYEQEIAMLRSRGTSQVEVVLMNLAESVILLLIALPFALILGWLAANLMGQTRSFLQFTQRGVLPFTYNGINLTGLLVAAGLVVLARVTPTWQVAQQTIIKLKQQQARSETKPIWQRFYLDFILLMISGYTYLSMRGWGRATAFLSQQGVEVPRGVIQQLQPEVEPYRDPLLFIAPAIFVIACSMILLRLVPLIARLLTATFGRLPGVWHYLSLQHVSRRPNEYSSALMLIMISLSLAIFSATAAKTLDQWLYDSIQYESGADLVVLEYPPQTSSAVPGLPIPRSQPSEEVILARDQVITSGVTLADLGAENEWSYELEQHRALPGIEDGTRVGHYQGEFSSGFGALPVEVLGIDRLEFPRVAFFREDFANESLGALMNALGADPRAVLVPRDFAESKNLQIGDQVSMRIQVFDQSFLRYFIVAGYFDYFPTVFPGREPVVIANLESIFGNPDSIVDYDTWLSLEPGADPKEVLTAIQTDLNLIPAVRGDAVTQLKEEQEGIERVGLFGVLNVGFLTAGLMPAIGFVLYSYASMRRRFIQLGILQAIGMSSRQLIGYLASEQVLLMSFAILGGAGIGLVASSIFVPFLQSEVNPVPPFQIFSGLGEAAWLSIVFAIVLALTMVVSIAYLTRLKVFQAIKLGETI